MVLPNVAGQFAGQLGKSICASCTLMQAACLVYCAARTLRQAHDRMCCQFITTTTITITIITIIIIITIIAIIIIIIIVIIIVDIVIVIIIEMFGTWGQASWPMMPAMVLNSAGGQCCWPVVLLVLVSGAGKWCCPVLLSISWPTWPVIARRVHSCAHMAP